MKLNESKTEITIVSMARAMPSQSLQLTIGGTVQKESVDLDILGVTIDSKKTFESSGVKISFSKTWYLVEVLARI